MREGLAHIGEKLSGQLEPVSGAEATPVPALHTDRDVDLAHHHRIPVAHITRVTLDQVAANVARSRKPGRIVEDAAIAAVRRVPDNVARTLRVGIDLVVHRQKAVAVDHGAKHHVRLFRKERFLEGRQRTIGPIEILRAVLHRIGAGNFRIGGVEEIVERDLAARHRLLENPGQRAARFHRAGHQLSVLLMD